MSKTMVCNILSIDGFTEGADGNVMAMPMDHAFDLYNAERMGTAASVLLGARRTAAGVGDSRSVVPSGATGEDVLHAQAPPQGVPRGRRARGSQP